MSRPGVFENITGTSYYTASTATAGTAGSCYAVMIDCASTCTGTAEVIWHTWGGHCGSQTGIAGMAQAGAQENSEQIEPARKAWVLLWSLLRLDQRRTLLRYGWFDVLGANGHLYRLLYRRHGNVTRIDANGKTIKAWCGHFGESLPIADYLVAQLLMISANPDDYERNANIVRESEFCYCVPMGGFEDRKKELGLSEMGIAA